MTAPAHVDPLAGRAHLVLDPSLRVAGGSRRLRPALRVSHAFERVQHALRGEGPVESGDVAGQHASVFAARDAQLSRDRRPGLLQQLVQAERVVAELVRQRRVELFGERDW